MSEKAERIAQQRALYGESVGEMVRRACSALALFQQQLAQILGLSPAMLSQLATGHRIKMANPLTVARLQAVRARAPQAPELTQRELADRLQEISQSHDTLLSSRSRAAGSDGAQLVRRVLRAVASAQELERAAQVLEEQSPGLARALRAYGAGSRTEAAEHFATIRHLLD